ncbi:hypothetical protein OG233_05785 [Streptomyces sp. NBC_01218]|uniref:hypothetical protein n=1 Tax=unclassified Streptomyces TaxID=2593676 RepID=UPI0023B95059|nr:MULTISPECIES: hypothetical protein [unclassified Streptomyces]WEH39067.1 hypothetical protein PZB77_05805 [Streptomyces sp. AM 2-1-1]WSQ50723.1 hypothetical protein OG233_05785 [Streptomyces sp. NBC_01218]
MFPSLESTSVFSAPEHEMKFAELMMRALLDPSTADLYSARPEDVLGEFGISLAEGVSAPALPVATGQHTVREEFSGLGPAGAVLLTLCINTDPTGAELARVGC